MTTMTSEFPIEDYAGMPREQLRVLVSGFTSTELKFALQAGYGARVLPKVADIPAAPELLDIATDGFLILGLGKLRDLTVTFETYSANALVCLLKHDDEPGWDDWHRMQAEMFGGYRRCQRFVDMAYDLMTACERGLAEVA